MDQSEPVSAVQRTAGEFDEIVGQLPQEYDDLLDTGLVRTERRQPK